MGQSRIGWKSFSQFELHDVARGISFAINFAGSRAKLRANLAGEMNHFVGQEERPEI